MTMQAICTLLLPFVVAIALLPAAATPARAQGVPETGGRVFGLVGGVFGDGDTTVLTSIGAGIRIAPRLGLDVEVLYVPDLSLPTDLIVIQTFGAAFAPVEREECSRLVAFLTKMTVEFPVANGRVWPYLTGGGGVDVRLWKGLAVGGDVRYLRLFDDTEGFDFAFVTSRISYRF